MYPCKQYLVNLDGQSRVGVNTQPKHPLSDSSGLNTNSLFLYLTIFPE